MTKPNLERGAPRARRLLLLLVVLVACVSSREPHEVGGESHFLRRCESACGTGLDCIQGVCTRGCVVGKDRCNDLAQDAVCTAASVEPGEVAVCDLGCSQDADCAGLSAQHTCEAGYCRAPAAPPDPGGGASDAGSGSGNVVSECQGSGTGDPVTVKRWIMQGDTLALSVQYSGGCKQHSFSLCFEPGFRESYPVQTSLRLIHDANDDSCEALPSEELRFDLTPLAKAYERSYRSSAGLISTNYGMYAFGKLSCEERSLGAGEQVSSFDRQVSRACQTSADCRWVDIDTACTARCGTIASNEGAAELSGWLATTSSAVCGDFEGDGCGPLIAPPCVPPSPVACVAGQCAEATQ